MRKESRNKKLRAMALDAMGERVEASRWWTRAAIEELGENLTVVDAWFRNAIGEAVACLAGACRPIPKEELRDIVRAFMERALEGKPPADLPPIDPADCVLCEGTGRVCYGHEGRDTVHASNYTEKCTDDAVCPDCARRALIVRDREFARARKGA
jgi:hypothetical protein